MTTVIFISVMAFFIAIIWYLFRALTIMNLKNQILMLTQRLNDVPVQEGFGLEEHLLKTERERLAAKLEVLFKKKYQYKSVIAIATFCIFGAGGAFVLAYSGYHANNAQENQTVGALPIVIGVIAAVAGLYLVKKKLLEGQTITS